MNQELNSKDLANVSDNDILVAAEEIMKTEELKKSEADLKGSEGSQDLAGPSGTQGPVEIQNLHNNGNEGTNMQPEQGTISMRGDDPKDHPPSEGSGPDANTQTGDNQLEGDKENRPLKKMGGQQPKDPGPEGKAPDANTQSGDAQDQANEKENRPLGGWENRGGDMKKALPGEYWKQDPNVDDKQGREDKSKTKEDVLASDMDQEDASGTLGKTQGGQDTMESNYRAAEDRMTKSIETLTSQITTLADKFAAFQKRDEELSKSITPETIEVLAKSYNKKIRNQEGQIEELQKSLQDVRVEMGKPARKRETVSNFDTLEKGNSEDKPQRMYKSKNAVLKRLEDLRQLGKVSGDEVIAYNANNLLTDNAKERLQEKD